MANRVLRDWTKSEKMDKLSPHAEILFTRLIMKTDDYGSYFANPKLVKSDLFPLKDQLSVQEVAEWIDECAAAGLLFKYSVEGKEYIRIIDFGQRLRNMRNVHPHPPNDVNGKSQQVAASRGKSRHETETKRNRNETETNSLRDVECDFFKSNKEAFDEISSNYFDIQNAQRVLSHTGWGDASEADIKSLLFHFLETQVDLSDSRQRVRQHFRNWLNKRPKEELKQVSQTIQKNYERRQGQAIEVR